MQQGRRLAGVVQPENAYVCSKPRSFTAVFPALVPVVLAGAFASGAALAHDDMRSLFHHRAAAVGISPPVDKVRMAAARALDTNVAKTEQYFADSSTRVTCDSQAAS